MEEAEELIRKERKAREKAEERAKAVRALRARQRGRQLTTRAQRQKTSMRSRSPGP